MTANKEGETTKTCPILRVMTNPSQSDEPRNWSDSAKTNDHEIRAARTVRPAIRIATALPFIVRAVQCENPPRPSGSPG